MKLKPTNYKGFDLCIYDKDIQKDKEYIKSRKEEIYQILCDAYQEIDGCGIYRNHKHMLQSVGRYKIVMDDEDVIYAIATYRIMPLNGSYKCTLIGGNVKNTEPDDYKTAVKFIIKSDIVNFQHLYWIEASGPVAHWKEKYGAMKIPAVYAPSLLNMNPTLFDFETDDEYKYTREIQGLDEPVTKTIFGFPSTEMIEKLISGEHYDRYVKNLIYILGDEYQALKESHKNRVATKKDFEIITKAMEYIIDNNEIQHDFHNVTKQCYHAMYYILKKAENILRYNRSLLSDRQRSAFQSLYYDYRIIFLEVSVIDPKQLF